MNKYGLKKTRPFILSITQLCAFGAYVFLGWLSNSYQISKPLINGLYSSVGALIGVFVGFSCGKDFCIDKIRKQDKGE